MTTDKKDEAGESRQPEAGGNAKPYHRPNLQEYGTVRDLTRSNAGTGSDAAPFDGVDSGLDGTGTAS